MPAARQREAKARASGAMRGDLFTGDLLRKFKEVYLPPGDRAVKTAANKGVRAIPQDRLGLGGKSDPGLIGPRIER